MKGIGAREVLDWYYREKYHPCGPLDALITSFRKDRRTADALEVALEHPHLGSARRLMKEKTKHAQQKFEDAKNSEPRHPTADFALGALHMTKGDRATARRHLLNALEIAPHPQQRATIQKWLTDIDARSAPGDQRS
jgi:tetratricopeptide (TPR) repeat protein